MTTLPSTRIDATSALAAWRAGAILIDVRSATGRQRQGELPGALIAAKEDVVDLVRVRLAGRNRPVILACGSVRGTEALIAALTAAGVTDIADVEGGVPALVAAGAPALVTVAPQPLTGAA